MKHLLLTSLIFCFHSLGRADSLTASFVAKKNNQLMLISDFQNDLEALNQVPFNSLKDLQIKATFVAQEHAILVFDISETARTVENRVAVEQVHVMTSQQKLLAAEVEPSLNAVKVRVLENGDVMTVVADTDKASFVGKTNHFDVNSVGVPLFLTSYGQLVTSELSVVGKVVWEGEVVALLTDLQQKIAILTGTGSEIVITGEKKEFLASMGQLKELNAQQTADPNWTPVTDLKISNLGSVLQIEFRNIADEESFSLFKLVSPLVVNQIKENKDKIEAAQQ